MLMYLCKTGVLITSIAIYRSIAEVVLVDRGVTLKQYQPIIHPVTWSIYRAAIQMTTEFCHSGDQSNQTTALSAAELTMFAYHPSPLLDWHTGQPVKMIYPVDHFDLVILKVARMLKKCEHPWYIYIYFLLLFVSPADWPNYLGTGLTIVTILPFFEALEADLWRTTVLYWSIQHWIHTREDHISGTGQKCWQNLWDLRSCQQGTLHRTGPVSSSSIDQFLINSSYLSKSNDDMSY